MYMFFGGTNFGFMNGANKASGLSYDAFTTSYDYDAPLSENGHMMTKFYMARDAISEILHQDKPSLEGLVNSTTKAYENTTFIGLLEFSDFINMVDSSVITTEKDPIYSEFLNIYNFTGQSYGYTYYTSS